MAVRAARFALAWVLAVGLALSAARADALQDRVLAAADLCLAAQHDATDVIAAASSQGFPPFQDTPDTHPDAPAVFLAGGRSDLRASPPAVFIVQTSTLQRPGERRLRQTTCGVFGAVAMIAPLQTRFTSRLGPVDQVDATTRVWSAAVAGSDHRALTPAERAQYDHLDALLRALGPNARLVTARLRGDDASAFFIVSTYEPDGS
jgi:hypothetical protein